MNAAITHHDSCMIPPKEFLKRIKPFSFLSEDELDILLSSLEVEIFEEGEVILKAGNVSEYVYLVHSGSVGIYQNSQNRKTREIVDHIGKGELFGVISAISDTPSGITAVAMKDTVCYMFGKEAFKEVFRRNQKFSSFFSTFVARRFRSFMDIINEAAGDAGERILLNNVGSLIHREPVVCRADSSIVQAARRMMENGVGSVVVVDDELHPVGILTDHDLQRVLVDGRVNAKVWEYMSSPVIGAEESSPVFEAYVKLVESGINHLVITSRGKVKGVITSKDILSEFEPAASLLAVYRRIRKAKDVEDLKKGVQLLKSSVSQLSFKGLHFHELSRLINSVYDAITERAIEIVLAEAGSGPGDDFLWVSMGSNGRKEQIIATDQDNALICQDSESPGELGELASRVNTILHEAGIPKCRAGYMAEKWCFRLDEWDKMFRKWFDEPTPEHVRYLSIFLDMRPIYGEISLYEELLEDIRESVTNQALRFLAVDATSIEPPLGFFGIKGIERGIDLKKHGVYPIVNGVRVMAVEQGLLDVTNTVERLEHLSEVMGDDRSHALRESFEFIQDLRLKHQVFEEDNLLKSSELDKLSHILLKESFKIISEFQRYLKARFGVDRV